MNTDIEKLIRKRAYEIYEYRKEYNITVTCGSLGILHEITPEDDWLESESEILGNLNLRK